MTIGSFCTSAGRPSAILRPNSIATTRSEIPITIDMWCSTSSTVRSNSSRICTIVSPSSSTSPWVSPDAGSSISRNRGRAASALAISSRLSVPNGRPAAGRNISGPRPSWASRSPAKSRVRRLSSATPIRLIAWAMPTPLWLWAPTITFSSRLIDGNRARFWNVLAIPRAAMPWAGTASRSLPSYVTRPDVGS